MEKVKLGKTSFYITRLGFGSLPMGKLQAKMSLEQGTEIIRYALKKGINFIDTACLYGSHQYIKAALSGVKNKIYIATKTVATDYRSAEIDVKKALGELGLKYIDIFHLHASRSFSPFKEHKGAFQCLIDYKKKGIIKAIGLATHTVKAVKLAAKVEEIDVIHPLVNLTGLGIIGGTKDEMLEAIADARQQDKGIYIMKALGGGNLLRQREKALNFVLTKEYIDAIVIGMIKKEEVDYNIKFFERKKITQSLTKKIALTTKKLVILEFLCKGCGECVKACHNQALVVVQHKAKVNLKKCLLCGYCAAQCPMFCLRVV